MIFLLLLQLIFQPSPTPGYRCERETEYEFLMKGCIEFCKTGTYPAGTLPWQDKGLVCVCPLKPSPSPEVTPHLVRSGDYAN